MFYVTLFTLNQGGEGRKKSGFCILQQQELGQVKKQQIANQIYLSMKATNKMAVMFIALFSVFVQPLSLFV